MSRTWINLLYLTRVARATKRRMWI